MSDIFITNHADVPLCARAMKADAGSTLYRRSNNMLKVFAFLTKKEGMETQAFIDIHASPKFVIWSYSHRHARGVEDHPLSRRRTVVSHSGRRRKDRSKVRRERLSGQRTARSARSNVSGRRIDQRKIELSNKLKGMPFYAQRLEVSEDGKTLTIVLNFPGVSNPEPDVYDRQ